jgi:Fic family protein
MRAICDFANRFAPEYFVHPVVRAILLHFWLAYDHPFVDGNGRTARALFYWSVLRSGYRPFELLSISEVILRSPKQYYLAFLHSETDENDATNFVVRQVSVIRKAIQDLHACIRSKERGIDPGRGPPRAPGHCLERSPDRVDELCPAAPGNSLHGGSSSAKQRYCL